MEKYYKHPMSQRSWKQFTAEYKETIGLRLAELRKFHGLKKQDMGRLLRSNSISEIEKGKVQLNINTILEICYLFNLDMDFFNHDNNRKLKQIRASKLLEDARIYLDNYSKD